MVRVVLRSLVSLLVAITAVLFFFYPGCVVLSSVSGDTLRRTAQPPGLLAMLRSTAARYSRWADWYLRTEAAEEADVQNVAATEWPMAGSVFLLVAAEDILDGSPSDPDVREALEKAATVVASPVTAAWVRKKWGEDYLSEENVFYRMLLILGLGAYQRTTGDLQYRDRIEEQRDGLAKVLADAPLHLADDYPGGCYPSDVLWAVAAIGRANGSGDLAGGLLDVLDRPPCSVDGLPAFQVEARSGTVFQGPRGSGNSAILNFAGELDATVAARWYERHVEQFWIENPWIVGFAEMPEEPAFTDVDSGPVVGGMGSVASFFGIGAARSVGRYDHAAPLTAEALAFAWPTPFGLLVPGLIGWTAADGWCLGETAFLFVVSRPTSPGCTVRPFDGPLPRSVWIMVAAYWGIGLFLLAGEARGWRRWHRKLRERSGSPGSPAG